MNYFLSSAIVFIIASVILLSGLHFLTKLSGLFEPVKVKSNPRGKSRKKIRKQ